MPSELFFLLGFHNFVSEGFVETCHLPVKAAVFSTKNCSIFAVGKEMSPNAFTLLKGSCLLLNVPPESPSLDIFKDRVDIVLGDMV